MRAELSESRLAPKRLLVVLLIWLVSLGGTYYLYTSHDIGMDVGLAYMVITVIFCACVTILLYRRRITGNLYTGTGYLSIALITVFCWAATMFSDRFDGYFYPVIIVPFLYCAVSDSVTAVFFSLYFCLFPAMIGSDSVYVLYCHITAVILGSILAELRRSYKKKFGIIISLVTVVVSLLCPIMFYYFTYLELYDLNNMQVYVYAAIVLFTVLFVFELLRYLTQKERTASFEKILDDEYSLIQDIKIFSATEYMHAKKVSWLSGLCAEEIGADRLVAMAGGMYYRLGHIVGEPHVKNAVKTAYNKCFPTEVISILEEYDAEQRLPSSRESAIVHMVDSIITRVEAFGENVAGSDWNQDMVVYQTLNEYSQQGIYDESGISMNQFLKIRDRLLREQLV